MGAVLCWFKTPPYLERDRFVRLGSEKDVLVSPIWGLVFLVVDVPDETNRGHQRQQNHQIQGAQGRRYAAHGKEHKTPRDRGTNNRAFLSAGRTQQSQTQNNAQPASAAKHEQYLLVCRHEPVFGSNVVHNFGVLDLTFAQNNVAARHRSATSPQALVRFLWQRGELRYDRCVLCTASPHAANPSHPANNKQRPKHTWKSMLSCLVSGACCLVTAISKRRHVKSATSQTHRQ